MIQRIHFEIQQNLFPEELKLTKQKIIYTNVTEDLFVKKKKIKKIITITIVESTENVYHVTRQNLYFAHDHNKNKNEKWQLRSRVTIKCFNSKVILFGLDWEEIISYGQIHFKEINNGLCKGSTA